MSTTENSADRTLSSAKKNVIGSKGKKVTLPCDADLDSSNYFLEWRKLGRDTVYTYYFGTDRGQPAVGFEGRLSHGSDGSLIIHTVNESDAGIYWCVLKTFDRPADNIVGQQISLAVHTLPYFVSVPPTEVFREKGQPASLICEAEGVPTPTVSWSKDNQTVRSVSGRVITGDGKLEILRLEDDDDGKYVCTAENSVGYQPYATHLKFAQPAFFQEPLRNRTAIDGSSLIWKCRAKAIPPTIKYRWFFGEREIKYSESLGLRAKVQGDDLSISSIRREDKGWYKCAVSNGYGSVKVSSAYLEVHYAPEISRLNPHIQYLPIGLSAAIKCDVDASPPASDVTWTKDGRYLNPNEDPRILLTDNGTRLRIETVDYGDKGLYTCQAFNYLGGGNNYEIHVFVEEPPYYVKEPVPKVTKRLGDSVEFQCAAGGKVAPKISWKRKDGRPLPERAEFYGEKNLIINKLTAADHGIYQCVVENRVTILNRDSYLIIQDTVPQPPENIAVKATAFEAKVSWTPGYSGGRRQLYSLKYRKTGDMRSAWNTIDAKNVTNYMLTHLHPDTSYEFVVLPRNELGTGFATSAFTARTKGAGDIGVVLPTDSSGITYFPVIERPIGPRPYPPENLVVANHHHRVLFMWEPPRSNPVKVYYYSLEYKQSIYQSEKQNLVFESSEEKKKFRTLHDQIRDTRVEVLPGGGINSLHPGETYDFRVKAHSVASFSEPSNTVTYTVPGVSSQTAVVAGVIGGVLFLLLFLLAGCILMKRSKQKKERKRRKHDGNGYANGHTPYSQHTNFQDTMDFQRTLTHSNGDADATRNEGIASVKRILCGFFRLLTGTGTAVSSSYLSRDSQQPLSCPDSSNKLEKREQNSLSNLDINTLSGRDDSGISSTGKNAEEFDLVKYLTQRESRNRSSVIAATNMSFDSASGLLKNCSYQSQSLGRTPQTQKHVTFAPVERKTPARNNRKDLTHNSVDQMGRYTRDNLLGTIHRLRNHANTNPSLPQNQITSPSSVGGQRRFGEENLQRVRDHS